MQDYQNQENNQSQENTNGVSFPTVGEQKKSSGAKTILIIGILVLVAILGFVIYKSASGNSTNEEETDLTSFENLTTPSSEQTVPTFTTAPSASPSANKVDKSKIQIQVQNGTGITGDAAYLQTQLGDMGYTNVKVGNSDATVTSTTVTFLSTLDTSVVTEITQKLNSLYQTVTTKTSATSTFDIVVVTGLKKGATSKPISTTSTPTPKSSSTSSPSPKASSTPTLKPTATP